jgi:hypothetical protein
MPIRQPKECVMTRLDAEDYAWIEEQAVVFGTRSAVLNRVVKVIRALISTGSLRWDLGTLQELLRKSPEKQRNFADSSLAKAERAKRIRPIRLPNIHSFSPLSLYGVRGTGAYVSPFRDAR